MKLKTEIYVEGKKCTWVKSVATLTLQFSGVFSIKIIIPGKRNERNVWN
jgi:hypothetical protein